MLGLDELAAVGLIIKCTLWLAMVDLLLSLVALLAQSMVTSL